MVVRIHIAEIHKKQPQRSFVLQFSHLQDPKIKFQTNANAFICGISSCFLIKHIGKNAKSLRILHNGYRNGISTYRFNTLWSLDSRTYVLFDTPFFQPDFYAMDVLFRNMPDVERILVFSGIFLVH